eukprot:10563736-Prorocentrum_lima.AAC.1
MTSSLVGSEMCIRDSRNATYLTLPRGGIPRAFAEFPQPALDFNTQPAVSYTHLTLPTICSV